MSLILAGSLVVLAGCGSGPDVATTGGTTTGTTVTTIASVTTTTIAAPSFAFTLTNAAGTTVNSISIGAPATLKATLKDAAGAVIPSTAVTFGTNATLATITPAAAALTDASGVATVTLNPATISSAGAATITASAQVGTTAVTGSMDFTVGAAAVTVSAPVLGVGAAPLSAFGTTSITVTVSVAGVPVTTPLNVTFSSTCANIGKAVLGGGVATVNGTAIGSYRDNGCAGTDAITASAAGVTSAPTNLVITAPAAGSIQFVSATPSSLSLKGTGGAVVSQVIFKVLDAGGNPISGKIVTFGLSTTVGGIALASGTGTSDASGLVVTNVTSGTVSTPVRVTASTPGATAGITLTTQSSGLTVTTGIPDQDSFSLSATKAFLEDGNTDGDTAVLTVRLADHFNNPVPDGTVVNFITTGGLVTASCSSVGSLCTSTLTVQAPRPANGRITVLAYAVGEESFSDKNGNGLADLASEMFDINNAPTDLGEAFIDSNGNGIYDVGEFFLDFNNNGTRDGPDGKYNGVLCNSAIGTLCPDGTPKSVHVRQSGVFTFSDSTAVITKIPATVPIDLVSCPAPPLPVTVRVVDKNNNPMPTGTTIAFTGSGGVSISGINSFVQENTGAADYTVNINDGAHICGPGTGLLTVTVTSPRGVLTPPVSYPVTLH